MNKQTENNETVPCWVYKSSRKEEMYLYLVEEDGYDEIPEPLKQSFGEPVFVMELELSENRKLARVDVTTVMQTLNKEGFFLQMPPKLDPELYFGD